MSCGSSFLMFFRIIIVVVINLSFVSCNRPSNISDHGWIRLCGLGGNSNLGVGIADKCSSGYWFKNPVKIGCACGHGVWVFAKGWCDTSARVIIAYNGSCFSVDKDVRYIRNIGNPTKSYMPYHFQTTSGFEYIQELPRNFEYTYYSSSYDQHLGAIFPNNEIESQNSRRCLEFNRKNKSAVAIKYFANKLPYRQTPNCYRPHGHKNSYVYDDVFQIDQFFALRAKSQIKASSHSSSWKGKDDARCSSTCSGVRIDETKNETETTFPPDYLDPLKDEYLVFDSVVAGPHPHHASNINGTGTENDTAQLASTVPIKMHLEFPLFKHRTLHDCDDTVPKYILTGKTIREINEQTKRMILVNLGYSLKRIATPKIEVNDYVLFQISRKILLSVCPDEEVPHTLVTGLLRMFRVAVKESLFYYPFEEKQDENKTLAILEGLKTCLSSTKPFTWNYENETNPHATCPTKYRDVTYEYGGAKPFNRTLQTTLPAQFKTDLLNLDLVVETAWKTVMLTHYYCSRHFSFNTSDYSTFYDKMEMFFNRWIQHRWYYPGPSIDAYAYVFQMYDLKKFAENLDKCVGSSRQYSNYRRWIKRPVYVKHCGGKSFQNMDNNPKSGLSKPKLDFIAPELTEFEKHAYCLPVWHSPVSNPGINYDPVKDVGNGCVEYKKYEWENEMTPNVLINWNNEIQ